MSKKTSALLEGRISSSLLRFAVPVFFALLLQSLYGAADLLIVGRFSTTPDTSAVGTGSMFMQTVTMVITGLAMGITILVGQKIGEGDTRAAGKAVGSAICIFGILAAAVTVILVLATDWLAALLHAPAEAFDKTVGYIRICGAGSVFIIAYNVLGAIFRGIGDSRTPLLTVIIACVLNIVGDVLFVAGLGMGAAGAAYATVISQAVSVILSLIIISRKALPLTIDRKSLKPDASIVKRELSLGFPVALQELLVGLSFLVIQSVVNTIGVVASAGVGVAEKACAFLMLVSSAYMQSMSAFVAQNIGAGRSDRAKQALRYGILTSLAIGSVIGLFTFFRGDLLAAVFIDDPQVITAAHSYLRSYSIDTLFTAVLFCFIGYYNGCGHTLFVMIQGIVGAIGVRLPVVLLMKHLGVESLFLIGLATPIATVVQIALVVGFFLYLSGKQQNDPQTEIKRPEEKI